MEHTTGPLHCSFCGKSQWDVRKLMAGANANICDRCIEVCVNILADDSQFTPPSGEPVRSTGEIEASVATKRGIEDS